MFEVLIKVPSSPERRYIRERCKKNKNKFTKSQRQTDGQTDGRPDGREHKESQRMEGETVMAKIERKAELSAEGYLCVDIRILQHAYRRSRPLTFALCLEMLDHVQTTCLARLQHSGER